MATVICDDTGEEVEVQPVHAVAISANQAASSSDGAPRVSKAQAARIQQAMANAVTWCYQEGITSPEAVKEKMQQAREAMKQKFIEEAEEAEKLRTAAELDKQQA